MCLAVGDADEDLSCVVELKSATAETFSDMELRLDVKPCDVLA